MTSDGKKLQKWFNWKSRKTFNINSYYHDFNLIFLHGKKTGICYHTDTQYILDYNSLLRTVSDPNWNVVGELINRYFKKYFHNKSVVIATEEMHSPLYNT